MKFQKADELEKSSLKKFLIYGPSGAGKTTLACTAPNPVFALTEKGRSSRRIAAMSKTLGQEILVAEINKKEDMDDFIESCKKATTVKTLVIDSITDYLNLLKVDLSVKRGSKGKLENMALTQQDWGGFQTATERVLRELVDLNHHVIVLAHHKEYVKSKGDMISRRIVPAFQGDAMPVYIGKLFQAVGFAYNETDDKGVTKYRVTFQAEDILTKIDDGLRAIEVPNVGVWFKIIDEAYEKGSHSFDCSEDAPKGAETPTSNDVGQRIK